MSQNTLGLLIGGFLPALLFAGEGILSKYGTKAGVGIGPYMVLVGIAALFIGLITCYAQSDWKFTWDASLPSLAAGFSWGLGSLLLVYALNKYNAPISQLGALYNTSTLFLVLFGLFLFAEWKEVDSVKLILGSLLIVGGSVLVSIA